MASKDSSPFKTVLWISLLWTLAMMFMGEAWISRVVEKERAYNHAFYSADTAQAAEARANRWFESVFVETGVMPHTFTLFSREPDPNRPAGPFDDAGKPLVTWFEGVLRTFWTILWQATMRISHVALWAPYVLFMFVPWVVDGLVARKVKQHTYDFTSPLQHRYSIMLGYGILLLALAMLTAPLPLHPVVVPVVIAALGFLSQRILSNYVKRA